jgi:PAS domain S-box-containing protein
MTDGIQLRTKAIEKAQNDISEILESMPDALLTVDENGSIVRVNKRAEDLFKFKRQDLLSMKVEELMPERYRGQHPNNRSMYLDKPVMRTMGQSEDLFALTKSGKEIPVDISLSPIRTDDGTLVLASVRDISSRKEAEKLLSDKMAELEDFNKLAVGRELRMIELKKEINELLQKTGKEPVFEIVE